MSNGRPPVLHVPANEYRRLRWRNGLGWTREILASPGAAEDWDWRLSIAEIEADAPYSAFPGVEREQVLLSGGGLALDLGAGDERLLAPPHGRLSFPGGVPAQARLLEGRAEVFNLMWRPARVAARLWHRPLVGSMLLFVDPGEDWAVHLFAGRAKVAGDGSGAATLEMGDTALLSTTGARGRYVVEGTGEVLLVRVQPPAG